MTSDVHINASDPRYEEILYWRLKRDVATNTLQRANAHLAQLERPERQTRVLEQNAMAFDSEAP
jgi:hypothetical protein